MKTLLNSIIKFIIATGLIVWMVNNGMLDLSSLSILSNPIYLILSVFLVFSAIAINNLRWSLLLKMQGFGYSATQTLPLTLIGVFFNFAIPGGVGGDVVKGYYLLKDNSNKKTLATTTLLFDRLMGMYGVVLISSTIMLVNHRIVFSRPTLQILGISILGLFLLITTFFILSFSKTVKNYHFLSILINKIPGGSIIQKLYESMHSYRRNPHVLFQTLILSLISQLTMITFVWFFAKITQAPELSFSAYMFIVPVGLISMVLPVTPAGIGIGQAALYYLYRLYTGIDNQIGPNALTAYQVILFSWGLFGAYFYVAKKKFHPKHL